MVGRYYSYPISDTRGAFLKRKIWLFAFSNVSYVPLGKGGNLDFLENREDPSKKKKNLSQFQKFEEQQKRGKMGQGAPK